ncbi:hypothetical protein PTKIN_Ptkin19aG0033400 [Pterospermum kingtungense]
MANSEDEPLFMHKNSPPKHQDMQGEDVDDHEDEVWGKGCDWFSLFCLKWRRNGMDETDDSLLHHRGEHKERWWKSKVKKLKEVSEKLAGPKWKNLIRKISGYCNNRKTQKNRFQYDPYSYALNFDKDGDDDLLFSSRFAAPFAAGSGV